MVFHQMIRAMYVIPERFAFAVNVRGYELGVLVDSSIRIEAIANSHLQNYATDIRRLGLSNRLQSFSLRVTAGGATLFYSGDVASFDEIRGHLDGCDILLLETSHVDMAEVKEFVIVHPEMRIVLTHLSGESAADLLRREFGVISNVQIAEEGMRVELVSSRLT